MIKVGVILLLALLVGVYIIKLNKKDGPSRYERKAPTPWNALNDGEDPTL